MVSYFVYQPSDRSPTAAARCASSTPPNYLIIAKPDVKYGTSDEMKTHIHMLRKPVRWSEYIVAMTVMAIMAVHMKVQ